MRIELFTNTNGKWKWRVRARNGKIVATGGKQDYSRRIDCLETARRVTTGGQMEVYVVPR